MNITEATNYIIDRQRISFKENWQDEMDNFMEQLPDKYLDKILKLKSPDDILKQIEFWDSDCGDEEEECDANFYWIAANLAIQKKSDRDQMVFSIVNRANNRD